MLLLVTSGRNITLLLSWLPLISTAGCEQARPAVLAGGACSHPAVLAGGDKSQPAGRAGCKQAPPDFI